MGERTEAAGPDPDSRARTHLANERTFLAWFRTGVTLMALGVAAAQFLASDPGGGLGLSHLLGVVTVGSGMALLLIGRARYAASRGRIDQGQFSPAGGSVDFSVGVFLAAGLIALLVVALANR
jgi:putative membrane protein